MTQSEIYEIIKDLYTDVFANNQCDKVDNYYHSDVKAYFNNQELALSDLKDSLAEFVKNHKDIKTDIEDHFSADDKAFTRLVRTVTDKNTNETRTYSIMVVKHFENDKVKKLWFMTDDPVSTTLWSK